MTLEDLKEVQKIDTELLFNVVDICEKHSIQYFLMYGTLLGAVRHKGPIPWDDDVDIGMTRKNYLKFLEVAKEELDSKKYNLKIMGSGSTRYISEIKIGKKGTLYCMPGTEHTNIMKQVQLDIFLIDEVRIRNPLFYKLQSLLKIIALNRDEKELLRIMIRTSKKRWKSIYLLGLDICHVIRAVLTEEAIERIIYKMFVLPEGTSKYAGAVSYDAKCVWEKKDFEQTKQALYSGRLVSIPIGYDSVLRKCYRGDYMQFPPEDRRLRSHFDEWIFRHEE